MNASEHEHSHHSHHSRRSSNEDLEKAITELKEEIKKEKPACRLTKARVAAITTVVSSAITAGITIATIYSKSVS